MFKVGDKVKVVNIGKSYTTYKDFIKENAPQLLNKWEYERCLPDGGSYEVKAIGKHKWGNELAIIEQNNKVYIVDFKGLELVKPFTKSDLKDNHIVVLKNGEKLLWENITSWHEGYTDNLIHKDLYRATINEVWEFDKCVWKREKGPVEILDKVEKKYLSDVIRPFKGEIIHIKKIAYVYLPNVSAERIVIKFKEDEKTILLPRFKPNTMYKNMLANKEYTLKELGLE